MPRDPLIGIVGKPSSGKSTTLNSLTDASSKVGNFPFTTIDPQRAVGYLQVDCACKRYGLEARCKPNYGSCVGGTRSVPIELLDVAGLVPGAHEGKGLGNKFLDDLRHADALIHVVDVSGTTDAEGKATRGYDPTKDIAWLRGEIEQWILGNLLEKWGGVKRRHIAIKATPVETLQGQFSGYGATSSHIVQTLDAVNTKVKLEHWEEDTIALVVSKFIDAKFPIVLALNKIDHADADSNIARIGKTYPDTPLILTSAISEVFLRKLVKQRYIRYAEGSDVVETRQDAIDDGDATGGGLLELDDKLATRIENLRDMVLFRFGGTGVVQLLSKAADLLGLVPVFPVRNVHAFASGGAAGGAEAGSAPVFRDCVLVKRGTTVRGVASKVIGDAPLAYIEGADGTRVAETEVVSVGKNDILSFKIGR